MRFKIIKIIIAVFVVLICSFLAISAKYYVKTVQSFKTFDTFDDVRLVSMQNECYSELKKSLDEKYSKKFVKIINETTENFQSEISNVLGADYLLLKEEFYTIKESIDSKQRQNFSSEEYLGAKKELSLIKEKIDKSSSEDKNEYLDEFRTYLNKISTLNTKYNNQIKPEREKLDKIKSQIKKLFFKNKKQLLILRIDQIKETSLKIKTLLLEYSQELKALKETFGISDGKKEFPFDINTMTDCLVAGKLETECYNDIISDNNESSAVFIENDCAIKS